MFQSTIRRHIAPLVHIGEDQLDRARHEAFVLQRLALALIGLALLPMRLASGGAPTLAEAVILLLLMVPAFGVFVVSRTGRLPLGQAIGTACLAGVAATASVSGEAGAALVWLLVLPIDAVFALEPTLVAAAGLASTIGAAGLLGADTLGAMDPAMCTMLVVGAILYVTLLAIQAQALCSLRTRLRSAGVARFQTLSEAIGDLVLRHDRHGAVLTASREAETLFGIRPRDLLGRGLFERVHVADRPALLKCVTDAALADRTALASLRLRIAPRLDAEGRDEPVFAFVELRARRVGQVGSFDEDGGAAVISVLRDVTAVRLHEMELEAARAEAERASQWKDRFLANTSHELRTPLNAIIGFSEMLGSADLSPKDPAKQREYAAIIQASGHHLLSVVNTILDMSKIEAGSFQINPEAFDLGPLVDSCCDMIGLKAREGAITLVRDVPPRLDELVADKRACRQILINLLSNAVKFTPREGRVSIAARPDGNAVTITVEDTGIGIQALDLPRLGDPFFQAQGNHDRTYEGTGLGLSVVRGLVGLHGGTMAIESAPGEGTRVVIRLPMDCRRAPKPSTAPAKIETISRYKRPVGSSRPIHRAEGQKIA